MPDWFDPTLFDGTAAKGSQVSGGPGTQGGGYGTSATFGDFLSSLPIGLSMMNPVTGPLTMALLGYSAKTGAPPTVMSAAKSGWSSLFGGADNGPNGLSGGKIDISDRTTAPDVLGGFHDLPDITGSSGDRMSGGATAPDGSKGHEEYARGGAVHRQRMGALARGLLNHPHPLVGALARALAVHHAVHGRR